MKKLPEVTALHPDKKTLINAVINLISITSVNDVIMLGPKAGFHGFVYVHDTSKFYRKHRKAINAWLHEYAAQQKTSPFLFALEIAGIFSSHVHALDVTKYLSNDKLPDEPIYFIEHAFSLFILKQVCLLFKD